MLGNNSAPQPDISTLHHTALYHNIASLDRTALHHNIVSPDRTVRHRNRASPDSATPILHTTNLHMTVTHQSLPNLSKPKRHLTSRVDTICYYTSPAPCATDLHLTIPVRNIMPRNIPPKQHCTILRTTIAFQNIQTFDIVSTVRNNPLPYTASTSLYTSSYMSPIRASHYDT